MSLTDRKVKTMFFKFTEAQKMMRKMAREFSEKEIAPLDAEMDRKEEFPVELFKKMSQNGFLGVVFPEEYQGGGADTVTGALVVWEIARASASVALSLDAHWLAADTVLYHGTDEQKKKYLPLAAQDTLFAFALTEPGAGSDAAGLLTAAVQEGGEYVLNGTKAWCTNAEVAGVFIIMAKTDKTKGAKGISAFIVEKGNPGLTVGKKEINLGMRGSVQNEVILNNCRVKKEALLGREGDGFKIAMIALDGARISIGAIAGGLCERAIAVSTAYARQRQAFGGPIANLQAIQFMIADMAVGLHAVKLMTFDTAALKDAQVRHTKEAAMTKILGSTHAVKCGLNCIQILGGSGYSRENPAERILRDAKMLEIGEGTTEILKMLVGRTELAG